jgi:tRNA-binding protein
MPPTIKPEFDVESFLELDIRVGTVLDAKPNVKARKPCYVLSLDFGPLGKKISSAQLAQNYAPEELIGRQVIAVVNFAPQLVAGVKSEVLVLAAVDSERGAILLQPERTIINGTPVA